MLGLSSRTALLLMAVACTLGLNAQTQLPLIKEYFNNHLSEYGLTVRDINELEIVSEASSMRPNTSHAFRMSNASSIADPRGMRDRIDARHDRWFKAVATLVAVFVLFSLAGAALSMLWGGRGVLASQGASFFYSSDWNPVENQYGALVPIYGTIVTALIAMLIAVPVSFGIAFFLTEVAPRWMRTPVGMAIELLAGVPSIIYGMWGFFVLMPVMRDTIIPLLNDHVGTWPVVGVLFQGPPIGAGMLTSGLVLAIMVVPFISSVMREVFLTVPGRLKESAYALGSTRWEVIWDIVLPYTRSAVIGGIFLGLGRALGETMAVAFVIGNSVQFTKSLLEPSTTIAALIANDFGEATAEYRSALLLLGFVLFIVTFAVLAVARLMLMQLSRKEGNR